MTEPVQPSVQQLVAAFAAAALPFAGPTGVAVATLIPAAEQLLALFRNRDPAKNYTVDELAAIVSGGSAELAKLRADIEALPKD